ncbi:hypothetical protein [Kordiimonas pumila]|uniref:DUF429 domain-containing protein n=1 Tax=Kordiimonas pumila TaxID=2161677 RepID=A0ABV7D1U2_9PROT|nr:hypothetical protein [Kordiimonas pumila]
MSEFTHFVGIDWSGARGVRHAGIAVAICDGHGKHPRLVTPPSGKRSWSRQECANWIARSCDLEGSTRILVGFDSAFSLPFVDDGSFLPNIGMETAIELWLYVDQLCVEANDLFGGAFAECFADYYLRPGNRGRYYTRRMRVTENVAVASGAGPCESVFHLIGPSQVGLSGLSTIRLLHSLRDLTGIAVWPFQDVEKASTVLVEIYAAAFAAMGGHRGKIRDRDSLKAILASLGSTGVLAADTVRDDHTADAIVTSAGLRAIAHESKYWNPDGLSSMVRGTEGWIFGIN